VHSNSGATPNQIRECLNSYYPLHGFVRVVSHLPATRYVARSNFVDITVRENGPRIILVSAIDNLVKGASGAAVQNMNYMFGLDPHLGLHSA
jgi:N-acetyl-gamma-glutamyl-phosphate reductase